MIVTSKFVMYTQVWNTNDNEYQLSSKAIFEKRLKLKIELNSNQFLYDKKMYN